METARAEERARLLVVDDDAQIRDLTGQFLETNGFEVETAGDCRECELAIAGRSPALVVLDVMLPDGSGLDLCRVIKREKPDVAIILLTALKEDIDRIVGLEIGADDYLVKPFNPRELAARIRAVLRRGTVAADARDPLGEEMFCFEGFLVDIARRRASTQTGVDLALTGTEFDLLRIFLERPGRLLSREQLAELLHGRTSFDPLDRTIDVTMSRLRRKFGDDGHFRLFKTVRNGGYQLAAPVRTTGTRR